MVGQADAVGRQAQRRARVEEARGKAPQAAVAQRRLALDLLDLGEALARGRELGAHLVVEPQVDEVVAQELADEELGGDVVEALLPLVYAARLGGVAHEGEQRVEDLEVRALRKRLARDAREVGAGRALAQLRCHSHRHSLRSVLVSSD